MTNFIPKRSWLTFDNCLAFGFSLFVFYFVVLRFFGPTFDRIPGDLVDSRFNNYVLEHGYNFLKGNDPSFWNAPFLYPEKNVVTYSDCLLGELPFYAVFRTAGMDRETAYQAWMAFCFFLNFLVCSWVFAKMGSSKIAAIAGGFVFAFALPVFDQSYHSQMIARYPIALAIYFLSRFIREQKHVHFFLFLLSLVWQFYNSIYLGLFLLLASGIYALLLIGFFFKEIQFKAFFEKKKLVFYMLYLLPIAFLFYKLLKPYADRTVPSLLPDHDFVLSTLPVFTSYFLASPFTFWNFLSHHTEGIPFSWNHYLFPGGLACIAILSLWGSMLSKGLENFLKRNDPLHRNALVLLFSLTLLLILTLRVRSFSLYEIFFPLPGFRSMRDLCRVINVELFCVGGIVAYVVNYMAESISFRWLKRTFYLTILAVVVVDNTYDYENAVTYSKYESQQQYQKIVTKIKSRPNYKSYKALVYMPKHDSLSHYACNVDAMLASQFLGMQTVNGYTGNCPYMYCNFMKDHSQQGLDEWFKQMNIPMDSTEFLFIR